jgi:hypothetical protein
VILEGIADAIVGYARAVVGVANIIQRFSDAMTPEPSEAAPYVLLRGEEVQYEEAEPSTDHLEDAEPEFKIGFRS